MNNQPASHISSVCSSYSTHNTTGKLYAQSITNPKWKHFVVKKKVETFNPEKKEQRQNPKLAMYLCCQHSGQHYVAKLSHA
jgi:hypothetical protein